MADYTLKDGKGTKIRESGALEEAYVDIEIANLVQKTSDVSLASMFAEQAGSNEVRKVALYTIKDLFDSLSYYATLWVPATDMIPSQTDGASLIEVEYPVNDLTHKLMRFPGVDKDTSAEFDVIFPQGWVHNQSMKARLYWTAGGDADPGDEIHFILGAASYADGDPLDAAMGGTSADIYDSLQADDKMHIAQTQYSLVVGNIPSPNDLIHFKLTRDYDYGSPTMDVDCDVFGVLIQFLENRDTTGW